MQIKKKNFKVFYFKFWMELMIKLSLNKIFKSAALLLFSAALLYSCANIQAPSGGPQDKTPPSVVEVSPADKSLNFSNNSINIVFDKYMERSKVIENLQISPSAEAEYSWSGKELEIEFTKPLENNTTYSISLGTDYTDIKGNKPNQGFSVIFSTGNYIDSGMIDGKIISPKPEGAYVFAYRLDNINPDTLSPMRKTPDYKIQLGANGNFELKALKDGTYRLFVVRDQFKDGLVNENSDAVGCATKDFIVKDAKSSSAVFSLGGFIDKTPPTLYSAEAINQKSAMIYFSEAIDSIYFNKNNISVSDSAKTTEYKINSIFPLNSQKGIFALRFDQALAPKTKMMINLSQASKSVRDTLGNLMNDSLVTVYFFSSSEIDSARLNIISIPLKDSSSNIQIDKDLTWIFDKDIDTSNLKNQIKFLNVTTGKNVEFDLIQSISNRFKIQPKLALDYKTNYKLSIDASQFISSDKYKYKDTILTYTFNTEEAKAGADVQGRLIDSSASDCSKVIILESKLNGKQFITKVNENGTWKFSNLFPGQYSITVFCDENNNIKYDYGDIEPFKFAEKFYQISTELNVRARWNIEDFIIKISK